MKVTFVNIDKKKLKNIRKNSKYVFISNDIRNIELYKDLTIKPIFILFNGSYVIDLENNNVIIDKSIDENSFNNIIKYSNISNIKTNILKNNNKIYEMILKCDNYHRRLIIPYMFKDIYPKVKVSTINKIIYITNKDVSLLNAIEETFNYLHINNNYIELEDLYTNISNDGYYQDSSNWKGYEVYEN